MMALQVYVLKSISTFVGPLIAGPVSSGGSFALISQLILHTLRQTVTLKASLMH